VISWWESDVDSEELRKFISDSKDLSAYIQSRSLSSCNSIKTFAFSILYTTIPHFKLKDKLRGLVQHMIVQDFLFRNCRRSICRVVQWIVYQAVYVMWFIHKNNIVRGIVGRDNNIFVMKERQVFSNIPPDCIRASSPFIYNPTGHVITGDIKTINNTFMRDVFAKGPKYRGLNP
jgi:hypothetical protein